MSPAAARERQTARGGRRLGPTFAAAAMLGGLASALLGLGCGAQATEPDDDRPPRATLGFAPVPSDAYDLGSSTLESGSAELFYAYRPAALDADAAPLFVVTSGGPGGAALLLAMDLGGLAELGHVLYIDARNAGFSYVTDPDAATAASRSARFGAADYNVYRDGADVASALLEFYATHPEHARREVVFVAESYGGARTAVLLDLFLNAGSYAAGARPFFSPALQAALERHLETRFGHLPDPGEAARAFRAQVLLQPIIAGRLQDEAAGRLFEQPGSILDELAAQEQVAYVRCAEQPAPCDPFLNAQAFIDEIGRSRYDYREPVTWLDALLDEGRAIAAEPATLGLTLAVAPEAVLSALEARQPGAFRFRELLAPTPTALDAALPELPAWDRYFSVLHPDLPELFRTVEVRALDADPDASALPALFVSNARYAATLITRAEFDLHVYAEALPDVLASLPGVLSVTEDVATETLTLTLDDGTNRDIQAPRFAASHAIGHDDAAGLVRAIERFLAAD